MSEQSSAKERLDAAVATKELSSYPHLKRAILRSRFAAILFTLSLPLLVLSSMRESDDALNFLATGIDAAITIGIWWLLLQIIKNFREQQWERLQRLLGVGGLIFLVIALLGITGAIAAFALNNPVGGLIAALLSVGGFVWRNDFIRAKESLLAMLANQELVQAPIDPAVQSARRKQQWRWISLALVLLVVLAGSSWLVIEKRRAAQEEFEQKRVANIRAKEAAKETQMISKANRDQQQGIVTLSGHEGHVNTVAFSPNGRILASGSSYNTVLLRDVASGKTIATLMGHTGEVKSVAFSPNGRTLASGSLDQTVRLWDVGSGKTIATLSGHKGEVKSVAFSRDGRTLASGSSNDTVRLWDVASRKNIATLSEHEGYVNSVAFSPNGRTLAAGLEDQTVRLWDVASGKIIATLRGHEGYVNSVAFSPDGRTLASGSSDQTVRLWDVASGRNIATLSAHEGAVNSVAFSPNGRTLASGLDGTLLISEELSDETVRLWDVASGKNIATLNGHKGYVYSVAFSPDGHTLASGSFDGDVRLWPLSPNLLPK